MKIVGLITEYNPFHNGHLYHVQEALNVTGADAAVVAMSGDFVQRGAPAVMSKRLRARMALECGVAAVFELPVCYATGSAELFALGAVLLLDALGADMLCFGSECGNLSDLQRLSDILYEEPEEYKQLLKTHMKEGISFPAARQRAVSDYLTAMDRPRQDSSLLSEPNNILAIEYLKALKKANSRIVPYTIRRVSSAYHDDALRPEYSSASAIRRTLECGEVPAFTQLETQVPSTCLKLLKASYRRDCPVVVDDFSLLLKYKLLNTMDEDLVLYQDVSQELTNRICKMQNDFSSYTQFRELLMTRQLTRTRVSRALLHVLLDVKKADIEHYLAKGGHYYARLLGFRNDCNDVVSEIARRTTLPLLTSPGKCGSSQFDGQLKKNARQMLDTDIFASNLYHSVVTDKYKILYRNELSQGILKV